MNSKPSWKNTWSNYLSVNCEEILNQAFLNAKTTWNPIVLLNQMSIKTIKNLFISCLRNSLLWMAVLLIVLSLSGFAGDTLQPDHIIIKADQYFPPYEFINKEGLPDGFNVDLMGAIAKELELTYTLEMAPWSEVREELEAGKIDAVLGIMFSEERAEKILFGVPHSVITHGIFTHKDKIFKSLEELRGKEIVVQNKDLMHDFLLKSGLTDHIIAVSGQLAALELINQGKHDAALVGNFQGTHLIKNHDLKNVRLRTSGLEPQKYSMAVSKGNEELLWMLNQGLYQLKVNGTYDRIYEKWFQVHEKNYFLKKYFGIILFITSLIIMLTMFILLLRFRVKKAVRNFMQSENRFRQLVQHSSDIIGIISPDARMKYISPSVEPVLGYTMEEMMKIDLLTLPHESKKQEAVKLLQDLLRNPETVYRGEWQIKHRDGSMKYFEVILRNQLFQQGIEGIVLNARDIDERKKSEELLKKSEERLNNGLKATNDGLWDWDLETNKTFFSDQYYRMLGYQPGEFEASIENWKQRIHPDDFATTMEIVNNSIKNQTGFSCEHRIKTKSGDWKWVLVRGKIMKINAEGKPVQMIGTHVDITEKKEFEQALQKSEAHLRMFIEAAPVGIIISDNDQNIILSNRKFVEMVGYTVEEAPSLAEWWKLAYPDEEYRSEIRKKWDTAVAKAILSKSEIQPFEVFVICKDGSVKYLEIGFVAIGERNIVSFVDISHRKKLEEMLIEKNEETNRFFSSSLDLLCIATTDGRFIRLNPEWEKVLGYSVEELEESLFLSYIHPDDLAPTYDAIAQLKDGEDVLSFENRYRCKNGTYRWIEWRSKPYGSKIYASARDVTDSKQTQTILKENEHRLKELNATKDKLISIIAHDLKNPFNSIIGFSNLLKSEARNLDISEIEEFGKMIFNSASNAFQLLENLLDWARMQQGNIAYQPRNFVLAESVSESIETLNEVALQKDITLDSKIDVATLVHADENMIKTVLRNLLSNAIKFTKPGGRVEITSKENGDFLLVSISDNGIGISEANQKQLFEIGSGFTSRGTSNEKGTGLGLILCKEFIEKQGGKIRVESQENKGTTFTFTVPLSKSKHNRDMLTLQ
ncbi:MAG: PAS domain S-box protein [Sphingobacteriia bacterium]|nr:PAS domain S-box protein [Sphingobacteriia bacterium]